MNFEHRFTISVHALVATGIAALVLTGQVESGYWMLSVGACLASLAWSWRHGAPPLPATASNVAMMLAFGLTIGPVVSGAVSPIRAVAQLLLALTAVKCVAPKASRDWLQLITLSFFHVLAASALTVEPIFGLVFLVYLLLLPWTLVLFHLRRVAIDSGEEWRLRSEAYVEPSLFRATASVTMLFFAVTIGLFILFPRAGAGFFSSAIGGEAGISGFSENVELGDVNELKLDRSIAMRVTTDPPEAFESGPRYFRGVVLDTFDGRRWTRSSTRALQVRRESFTMFSVPRNRANGDPVVRQEILLEPVTERALFSVGRVLAIRGALQGVVTDSLGNLHGLWDRHRRLSYTAVAAMGPATGAASRAAGSIVGIDPRVLSLAARVVDGAPLPSDRADRILDFLRRGFRYSLEPGPTDGEDPLARFLLETKAGHCEYFASSMALMLRAVGIPSRIVNGYRDGEWNEYGDYLLVRNSDAHSWVEAHLDGEWRHFDPTPPFVDGGGGQWMRDFAQLNDAMRMRWYRYVVNYGLGDQFGIALAVRDQTRRSMDAARNFSLRDWTENDARGGLRWVALLILIGALTFVWRRRFGRPRRDVDDGALRDLSRRYLEAIGAFAERGLEKRASETPDEFCERVTAEGEVNDEEARLLRDLTATYQRGRFGTAPEKTAAARVSGLGMQLQESADSEPR